MGSTHETSYTHTHSLLTLTVYIVRTRGTICLPSLQHKQKQSKIISDIFSMNKIYFEKAIPHGNYAASVGTHEAG